ncbi:MAG: YcjF family protein [Elainellaceae cyanobacterium]
MSRTRILVILIGIVLTFGLTLWLVVSISQLYYTIALTSRFLANVILVIILAVLAALIGALIYYAILFQRPRQSSRRPIPTVSDQKAVAAGETLQAIRQQVSQIQDEVARQVLLERSRDIEENLARGELRVVIFGTGSAGKTSVLNAILGRIAGQVGAPMGTTGGVQTYRFRLKGVEREIWFTDTPGISEAGIQGTQREQIARQLATQASLLLFVIDTDLRQSEYKPLQTLAEIGKRSLIVFNKADLYTDADLDAILSRLGQRVQSFNPLPDIVAIAANPQPIQLDTGERIQPDPDVLPLLKRMAVILRQEGEDLVADNILLQSHRLGKEARQIINEQRHRQANQVVERFQWISGGVISMTPLPVVDLLATAAINAQMVVEIGRIYGCDINLDRGRELAISLAKTLTGLGIVKGAVELFSMTLQLNAGTFVIGRAIQGVTGAYLTRIAGKSFIEYFRRNQDWGDGGITEVVQHQFQLNRRDEFIRSFVQEAIARVVNPIITETQPDFGVRDRDKI